MKITDAHIHYDLSLGTDRILEALAYENADRAAFLCIPKGGSMDMDHAVDEALCFAEETAGSGIKIDVFGGIDRNIYLKEDGQEAMAERLREQVRLLSGKGCTGIKMLEGKPNIRKAFPVPDFDSETWESYWTEAERTQIPIIMHMNDPETFWDASRVDAFAKSAGWFYDDTYVNNEDQYSQMDRVLVRHPELRILFPHFYFMSMQLERLADIFDRYPNVYTDVTPGTELILNMGAAKHHEAACRFFTKYQDRILYGTDIGGRQVIRDEPASLNLEESRARVDLVRTFLETEGEYLLADDGAYFTGRGEARIKGLGLPDNVLEKICRKNYRTFATGKPEGYGTYHEGVSDGKRKKDQYRLDPVRRRRHRRCDHGAWNNVDRPQCTERYG